MMANIGEFLNAQTFAVAGVSKDRGKYGNKVLRALLHDKHDVVGLHPSETEIEGAVVYPTLNVVPQSIESLSIVTPPPVTAKIVSDAIQAGVKNIWMQPGAEHEEAIAVAKAKGINVIANGPCILVELARHADDR